MENILERVILRGTESLVEELKLPCTTRILECCRRVMHYKNISVGNLLISLGSLASCICKSHLRTADNGQAKKEVNHAVNHCRANAAFRNASALRFSGAE